MADKSEKFNVMLPRSLWQRLHKVSAVVGYSRAQFIRLILSGACDAKDPSIYVPRKAQVWMTQSAAPQYGREVAMSPPREAMSNYSEPRPSQAPPMYPPKAPQVFDPIAAADWYKKGLVRFKGDRTEALAYTRRCVSLLPKEWAPPDADADGVEDI
jgi:hypothetical protein